MSTAPTAAATVVFPRLWPALFRSLTRMGAASLGFEARSTPMTAELRWAPHVGLVGILALTAGCAATPPPSWAEGGAPLAFGHAVWTQVDGSQLELDAHGRVLVDGDVRMALDAVGRVVDDSNDPVALLDDEGQLFGTDKAYLGRVGLHNAAPPWSPEAWVRVTKKGTVVLFDADGEAQTAGFWEGCEGAVLRACTLLTHLVLLEAVQRPPLRGPYYGPSPAWYGPYPYWGMGFGVYY